MSECTHDCSNCGENCSERNEIQKEQLNNLSSIKKVIGVVSGKGGVGKSVITGLAACEMARRGFKVGVLDADITGPSIPQMFGVHEKAYGTEEGILPQETKDGIKLMSINLLMDDEEQPVIWRGPVIGGAVKQFWTDVIWGQLDYLVVDMPPGTGDVPLTVFQSLPVDGIVIVTSPQQLVGMIVKKAFNMAKMMDVPVLGIVENFSYAVCPDCGKHLPIFGESRVEEVATELGVPVLATLPIDPAKAAAADAGTFYDTDVEAFDKVIDVIK